MNWKRIFRSVSPPDKVVIPPSLVEKLKPYGNRFLKVRRPVAPFTGKNGDWSGKEALEMDWLDKLYSADDPSLLDWLDKGGNYGIAFGQALVGIDLDTQELVDKIHASGIVTLEIRSGSGRGVHIIILTDINENGTIDRWNEQTKEMQNVGNVQADRKLLVAPTSLHKSGGRYTIERDAPIAYVTKSKIEEIFGDELHWTSKRMRDAQLEALQDKVMLGAEVPIGELIDNFDTFRPLGREGEFQGANPLANHGSEGGHNLNVNTKLNTYFCFRHNFGGGVIQWTALKLGLVTCDDLMHGEKITGEKFKKVAAYLKGLGYELETEEDKQTTVQAVVNAVMDKNITLFCDQTATAFTRIYNTVIKDPKNDGNDSTVDTVPSGQITKNESDFVKITKNSANLRFFDDNQDNNVNNDGNDGTLHTLYRKEENLPEPSSSETPSCTVGTVEAKGEAKGDTYRILSLDSRDFKTWLSYEVAWKTLHVAIGSEILKQVIEILRGLALEQSRTNQPIPLHNRVGKTETKTVDSNIQYWLDVGNPQDSQAICITSHGWQMVSDPPILFRRYSHQLPVCLPDPQGDVKDAWSLLDFMSIPKDDEDTRLLLMTLIVTYLIPDMPHPALVIYGAQGSGKSWLFRFIRRTLDPSAIELLAPPEKKDELAQMLDHHWLAFFDNLTTLHAWESEAFCRAVTGAGTSKRQLYTDDEDKLRQVKRCIGINGINVSAQKGDLLDRSLLINLVAMPPEKRRPESEMEAAFKKAQPKILGGLFVVLAKAMRVYPTVKLSGYQRMADFNQWGAAIAVALGKSQDAFIAALTRMVAEQSSEALNADNVAQVVLRFAELEVKGHTRDVFGKQEKDIWVGEPTELFNILKDTAQALGVDVKGKNFPKAPNQMVRRINMAVPALQAVGVKVYMYRGSRRLIGIDATGLKKTDLGSVKALPSENMQKMQENMENLPNLADFNEKFTKKHENNEKNEENNT